jgi:1-acyl-sn-glycerol-3-phosphate acyltransferase
MRVLRVLDYEFVGTERLGRPGQLIVANHPSLIDVVFLLGFTPNASCVVKHALWHNPFTRWPVSAAQYVRSQPTDEMLAHAAATLDARQSVILFPEGTRTTPGQPLKFHRGAASIAVKAATAVTPVFIRCTPTTLTKSEAWYHVPGRRVRITFVVGEDLDLADFQSMHSAPLAARAFNEHMIACFDRALSESPCRDSAAGQSGVRQS